MARHNWWSMGGDSPLFSVPPPPIQYIVHEPSVDDCGDYYVIVNGVKQRPGYWSYSDAVAAFDDYLWRGMVIG